MNNKLLPSLLLCLFSTGITQAGIRTVTNTDGTNTGEGSFIYEMLNIADKDTLLFTDDLKDKTINITATFYPDGNKGEKNITIIGNGVALTSASKMFYLANNANRKFASVRLEKLYFKDIYAVSCNSPVVFSNCVFRSTDGATNSVTILTNDETLFESCAFIAENNSTKNSLYVQSASSAKKVSFVSCTFVRKYEGNQPFVKLSNASYFTNCVFVDPNNTGTNYTISIPESYLSFNGYNVIQGSINGSWGGISNNQATDKIVAQDADAPLYYADGIYKVVVADGSGPAYKILPANPAVESVSFPQYDLAGTKINYAKASHAGAWQTLYGEEPIETVYPVKVTVRGIDEGAEILCNTTFKLTAAIDPNGCDQAVTWESSDTDIATIDENGQVHVLYVEGDGSENREVTFTATTVAPGKDGERFTASVTIKVKPYVRVTGFYFTVETDTIRSLWGVEFDLNREHRPTIAPDNAIDKNYTYSIDDPEVATLAYNNDWKAFTLKGKKAGKVILKAISDENPLLSDSCVYIFHDPYYSNVKGAFFLGEGTFPACGEIHFINEETGIWDLNIYRTVNNGQETGITTQFATIYGDHFFFVSKQENRLAIADKTALAHHKAFKYIHNDDSKMMDGRAFLGVDENTGYVGTSGGIAVVKFDELLGATADAGNVVKELPFKPIEGTLIDPDPEDETDPDSNPDEEKNPNLDPSLYKGQVGTMLRVGDRVFAIQQNAGILVINALTHQLETILKGNYSVLTQSKDGNLWAGGTLYESTGALGEAPRNALIRIDPWLLEMEEIALREGVAPPASWGAWQADPLCASAQKNCIYWVGGGGDWLRRYIYEYDIDTKEIRTVFDSHEYPTYEGYTNEKFNMYGCPFRIHPETDELYVAITTWHINPVISKCEFVKVNPETKEWKALPSGAPIWSALWIFPDNYAPVISSDLGNVSIRETTRIYLGDKVTDTDNLDAAIIKTPILKNGEDLITARVWRDSLIITPVKRVAEDTQTTLTLKVNSNGQVVTKSITVTVEAEAAIVEYPFELTAEKVTIKPGDEYRLALTAAAHYPSVRWSSSHPEVATVTSGGLVKGLSHGIANIIVRDLNSTKADTCMVTVIAPSTSTKDSIALNTTQLIMNVKETASLSVVLLSGGLTGKTVKWSTSDASVADVTSSGKVMAVGMGAAIITASIDDVKATCTVMVRDIAVNADVSSIEDKAAAITFPKMASAAYYLMHVYEMVNNRRQALITLKVNAEGEVDIAYALRAATNAISITLSTLKPNTTYEVDVEVVRIHNSAAEVITTLTTSFKTKGTPTSIDPAATAPAVVSYTNGILYVQNLEGYRCQVVSINGQTVKAFTVNSPDESHALTLPSGVYILHAEKSEGRKIFKIVVR
ncbi:MAG: DUF5074 domain-containing protein [Tannerellaceae bacterium]|jgi:uncharacterized protein YjdB|nr:DUF5074 domain-containing protein [Tannerellaceae bacterium]